MLTATDNGLTGFKQGIRGNG